MTMYNAAIIDNKFEFYERILLSRARAINGDVAKNRFIVIGLKQIKQKLEFYDWLI